METASARESDFAQRARQDAARWLQRRIDGFRRTARPRCGPHRSILNHTGTLLTRFLALLEIGALFSVHAADSATEGSKYTNRLANEKSPYLLQHASMRRQSNCF